MITVQQIINKLRLIEDKQLQVVKVYYIDTLDTSGKAESTRCIESVFDIKINEQSNVLEIL